MLTPPTPDTAQTALFDAPPAGDGAPPAAEARPGYQFAKRIGWIPEDWRLLPLGDCIASGPKNGLYKPAEFYVEGSGGTPIARIDSFDNGDRLRCHSLRRLRLDASELNRYELRAGDLVINRVNSLDHVGKTALVEELQEPTVFESNMMRVRVKRSLLTPQFSLLTLASPSVQSQFKSRAKRAIAQTSISGADVRGVKVALPPLPEQRAIARVLGAWDRALADLDALVAAKRQRARGLAQRLLTGRARLPGSEDSAWRTVRLTDVTRESRTRNDGTLGQDRLYGVTKAEGMVPNQDRINVDDVSRYKVVRPDAFAYNPMRLNIGSIARLREPSPVLASPDYVVFECLPDKLDPGFLDHLRRGHDWRRFMEAAGAGSVRVRVYYKHLRSLKVSIPEAVEEQRRIAAVLDAAGAEVAAHEAQRAALAAQKRGLMQRLLTGEVRVTLTADLPGLEDLAGLDPDAP